MNKTLLGLILSNAIFLSTGIILILVSCIQFDNWWPFLTVFINMFAIFFPTFCGGCSMDEFNFSSWDEDSDRITPASLSWLCLGFFIIMGYAIPIELYRGNLLSEQGVYLTLSGGTVILASILIFVRVIYFKKDRSSVYFF